MCKVALDLGTSWVCDTFCCLERKIRRRGLLLTKNAFLLRTFVILLRLSEEALFRIADIYKVPESSFSAMKNLYWLQPTIFNAILFMKYAQSNADSEFEYNI